MDRGEARQAPRVRSWIRKLALFVLPVLVAILGITLWDYVEMGRLSREIEAIRAKGEPVNGNALIDPQHGQADNAEYRYAAAAVLATKPNIYSAIATLAGPGASAVQTSTPLESIRQWLAGSSQQPSLDRVQAAMNELTSEWQEAFSLVDNASTLPYRGMLAGNEYSYRVSGLWNMLRLLSARTIGLAVTGEGDAAVNSAISSIKLRRAIRPSQRSVRPTHEVPAVLSLSKPSDDSLSRLQKVLADEEDADGLTRDFLASRAQLLDIMLRQAYGVGPGRLVPRPFPWELLPSPWMRPLQTHRIVDTLRAWAEFSDIAHKPWPERAALGVGPLARYAADEKPNRPVSGAGTAAMLFQYSFVPDGLVQDRASRIAVAVERYRRAHGEALPTALTDLVPAYLAAIPEDPLTGKPLLYRIAEDAYTIYSVGPNGKDDGGSLLRKPDPTYKGPGTIFPESADRGIRVLIRK